MTARRWAAGWTGLAPDQSTGNQAGRWLGSATASPTRPLAQRRVGPVTQPTPPNAASLDEAIRLATAYLVDQCDDSGRFVYLRSLASGQPVGHRYNELRHCGAIYALGLSYRQRPDDAVAAAILRASRWLLDQAVGPVPGWPQLLAVWSPPGGATPAAAAGQRQAKLGGAALALVALAEARRIDSAAVDTQALTALGAFIAHLQQPDGSFASKRFEHYGRWSGWQSEYYPGEAVLGLTLLHQLTGDPATLASAANGMAWLGKQRSAGQAPAVDHWSLLASEPLRAAYDLLDEPPMSRAALSAQVVALAEGAVTALAADLRLPPDLPLPVTPLATRLEGLLAARRCGLAPAGWPARPEPLVTGGIRRLLATQLRAGPVAGAWTRLASLPCPADAAEHPAGSSVRIDYVQHALAALLAYRGLYAAEPASTADGSRP